MKKIKKMKLKIFFISIIFIGILFSGKVFGADLDVKVSDNYKKWNKLILKEKEDTQMPNPNFIKVPDSVLNKDLGNKVPSLLNELKGNFGIKKQKDVLKDIEAAYLDDYYHLNKQVNLRVENQKTTYECWAFSMLKSFETNIAIRNNTKELSNFSERHMNYSTSNSFTDGTNTQSFYRDAKDGGLPVMALAYLTNGQGAVLESQMPFEDNSKKIKLEEIDKTVDTVLTEYISLPNLNKEYTKDSKGNTTSVKYTDNTGKVYTEQEVENIRYTIKKCIVENGAIATITAANNEKYYNNVENIMKSVNYNCNDTNIQRDHGITIVGWDDKYSKDNFADGVKPSTDGAYIVLNSYGEESFNNGYMYISYEDYFIESELYSIKNTEKKDYDNIYQADFYGGIFSMGTTHTDTGFYANVYKRDKTKKEIITNIGLTVPDYVKVEIFINPNDSSLEKNLIKIGESDDVLESGYHRINVEPTQLTGEEFAIVVKQKSENGIFFFSIETPVKNTVYANVKSENNSYYSFDGKTWSNLSVIQVEGYDMKKTDVCIKVFVTEETGGNEEDGNQEPGDDEEQKPGEGGNQNPGDDEEQKPGEGGNQNPGDDEEQKPEEGGNQNPGDDEEQKPGDGGNQNPGDDEKPNDDFPKIVSKKYLVKEEKIYKIPSNTSIENFKDNIETLSQIKILDGDKEITNTQSIIKTGMTVKLDNRVEYKLIVRGDINCDGKLTLTDLSKLILHYNETKGYILSGYQYEAADMNFDKRVSLTDVSQMLILYNEK